MEFLFKCSTWYLMSSLRSFVRYLVLIAYLQADMYYFVYDINILMTIISVALTCTCCRISFSRRSFKGSSAPGTDPGVLLISHWLSICLAQVSIRWVLGNDVSTCESSWYPWREIENRSMMYRSVRTFCFSSSSSLLYGSVVPSSSSIQVPFPAMNRFLITWEISALAEGLKNLM